MSVAFSTIPYCTNSLYDPQEVYQLLLACQKKLEKQSHSNIISFSQTIRCQDPLIILDDFLRTAPSTAFFDQNSIYFYGENQRKNEAILGYGTTQLFCVDNSDRFVHSKNLIEECFKKIIKIGSQDISEANPHIFCGFSFFSDEEDQKSLFPSAFIFLPRFQIIKTNKNSVLTINLLLEKNHKIELLIEQITFYINKINSINHDEYYWLKASEKFKKTIKFEMEKTFKISVESTLKSIQSNQFNKLVLAHPLDLIASQEFSITHCLNNLRQYHPDCYVFALSNGQGNSFIGASPERLISVSKQQLLTDALAGSAPRGKTQKEDQSFAQMLLNNQKERREHQVVIDFITDRLKQLGLKPQFSPMKVLQLSNIQHLWTPIYSQLPPQIHPLEIVAQLHPTPAVAGFPTEIACQEIRRYENFKRGLYAAPLGWINYQGNSEFIVGIRSALISGNQARLYAGAGIVEGSEPDKELAEIQLKFQGLLRALLSNDSETL
ncbi:isochorismate synthase [Rippkaea orientalis PCC 8801]|uniref:isochorismate synthase n=1 Tax=Rippkaea orientalis (strain PCC 8801 / RF-1) TaxID=41431 RepID=B7JUN1_RIPO1|nr:isochorismate synthase [Rippkaea orientalis]ACK65575.1 isochorismate synthase [Rippkaea orientalis PCC 8801]